MVSKYTGLKEDELVEWSFYRFYMKVSYITHNNQYQKRLRDIYARPN